METTIIFPHQLYKSIETLDKNIPLIIIEEWLFFHQYQFHKQKLVLHRASMQFYKNYLEKKGFSVSYIEAIDEKCDIRICLNHLSTKEIKTIHYYNVVDNWLEKRLVFAASKNNITLNKLSTPNFINTIEKAKEFFKNKKTYFQTDYYIHQRKELKILIDENNKPLNGKWTFDAENREKYPKNTPAATFNLPKENDFVEEAKKYVSQHFNQNYGSLASTLKQKDSFYPTTFEEAEKWLQEFFAFRLYNFGKYEDAMVQDETVLNHSVLTPMLNIGLLNPADIVTAAIHFAQKNEIPINSLEGFIRQIIGWREFIRIIYELEGSKQRTTNFWNFDRKIPASFYTGTTGIVPIDDVIKKVLDSGYNHHIERLMVLGNFMLLCEFDPNDVHKWFMEMYVDAYDWVMVPNVYGMTQFADGGLITTKPYISGSNYILKMSNYPKGAWQEIWDGLFWRFMDKHRNFFLKNPRLGMLIGTFDKMNETKKSHHLYTAELFLKKLDKPFLVE